MRVSERTDEIAPLDERVRDSPEIVGFRSVRAQVPAECGRTDEARAELAFFAADGFAVVPRDNSYAALAGCDADARMRFDAAGELALRTGGGLWAERAAKKLGPP